MELTTPRRSARVTRRSDIQSERTIIGPATEEPLHDKLRALELLGRYLGLGGSRQEEPELVVKVIELA